MLDALLEALLESWDRNNAILINLLQALPDGAMDARPMDGSPTIGGMFMHIHYVRLALVSENAPECAVEVPPDEWRTETDRSRLARMLNESAGVVREAVQRRLDTGKEMNRHYDHPILMLQHLVWHEGYHHGQMKLALKAAGLALDPKAVGRVTWGVWLRKSRRP